MMAAIVLGRDVLPPPAGLDGGMMLTAIMIHFPLLIVYGLALGWIAHRVTGINAFSVQVLFGLVIYLINFYLIAPVMGSPLREHCIAP
jgi:uncharacterized membrane protein YagU involved in acid resistance